MGSSDNRNLGRVDAAKLPSPMCPDQEPLFVATKLYLSFLQGLFGSMPTGTYRWDAVEENTEILITDQAPIPLESLGKVPAIVTIRSPAMSADLAMDHNMDGSPDIQGNRRHIDLLRCTMTLNCISRNGVEAQRIAYLVYWGLKRFRRLLMKNTILHEAGKGLVIASETPPGAIVAGDTDPGPVMVQVQSPFMIQESWSIEDLSEKTIAKSIEIQLSTFQIPGVTPDGARLSVRESVEYNRNPMYTGSPPVRNLRPPTVKGKVILQQTLVAGEEN